MEMDTSFWCFACRYFRFKTGFSDWSRCCPLFMESTQQRACRFRYVFTFRGWGLSRNSTIVGALFCPNSSWGCIVRPRCLSSSGSRSVTPRERRMYTHYHIIEALYTTVYFDCSSFADWRSWFKGGLPPFSLYINSIELKRPLVCSLRRGTAGGYHGSSRLPYIGTCGGWECTIQTVYSCRWGENVQHRQTVYSCRWGEDVQHRARL